MPSYVVNGVTKGIGYEFLRQLSADPGNTVVGLARDVPKVQAKVKADFDRSNVHIIHGDLDSYDSFKKASETVHELTGGSLDYLIANGTRLPGLSHFASLSELGKDPLSLEEEILLTTKSNVVGHIHLFNVFVPLLLKGTAKKAIFLSSGHADLDLVNTLEVAESGPYAIHKAATNMVVAKFAAEYGKRDGVLFMSISPGVVETGNMDASRLTEAEMQKFAGFGAKLQALYPHFTGPISPEESVKAMIEVYEKASVENGDGGSFVSHLGTKQWV